MYDIEFFMKYHDLDEIGFDALEDCRSKEPFVFNIETTNKCNLTCPFCPRTTRMTRSIATMSDTVYEKVIQQLRPHPDSSWQKWKAFVENVYGLSEGDMSENHFYLYVSPKCVTLHGFGDPVLDKGIARRVQLLTDKHIPTYFSMNPANINLRQLEEVLEAGLSYLKFSIDTIYNDKAIRGKQSTFDIHKLYDVLNLKNSGYDTKMILTMIQFSKKQEIECNQFLYMFKDIADYIYVKSQDNRWLYQQNDIPKQKSVHWSEVCRMPWSSLSILSQGYVVPCHQIYNAECILGHVDHNSLEAIWNGYNYTRFRKAHLNQHYARDIIDKCLNRCDMKLIGEEANG